MTEPILLELAGLLVLGIGAQWLAWRLRIPAILLLLVTGFAVGPGMQALGREKLIDPAALFGDLLPALVSLSVAVVLFEGGLSLNFAQLKQAGRVILLLVTIGAAITCAVSALAARWLLGMPWPLAWLLGSILSVTGPTVIGPLLRHVRPIGHTGPILKWEGIVIDPIGAILTVLVFEAILRESQQRAWLAALEGMGWIVLVGGIVGVVTALLLTWAFRRYFIPDYLQNAMTLATVVAGFAAANQFASESGLLAVTVMGLVLGNQHRVKLAHITEFKENLSIMLVSGLFIVLASRLSIEQVRSTSLPAVAFTALLILVARPLAVAVSTLRSSLSWRERLFLAWMAPRGIVAASVASLFALRLQRANYPGSSDLVPVVFTVIVGTVIVYGLTAPWLSRRLSLSATRPGFLIAGANRVAQAIAAALQAEGQTVLLVESRFDLTSQARLHGLPALYGSVLSQFVQEQIELTGIGRLLALTPNEEVNSLAAMRYSRVFGHEQVFQVAPDTGQGGRKEKVAPELQGRGLFAEGVTYDDLESRIDAGHVIKRTLITETFTFADFQALHGEAALPLFVVEASGNVDPAVAEGPIAPQPGQALVSLTEPRS
ncbi:MAG TPA: sodium:proton antiporter [Pirellulales bacterium]|jgi:NhaP-type Na+/H+ or K+/H+ antiporter|nr:sodium:proton antiporter [Pirellulales bacterium]